MKTNKIRTIVTLCTVLVLSAGGLYYLNHHQSNADNIGSTTNDVAVDNFGSASSSASADAGTDDNDNSSIDYSDSSPDFSSPDDSSDSAPVTSTTSTTGTVSAAQSSALLDKACIASGDTDYATINVIIKDDQGDLLVGDSYKPQANVSPLNGLTGNIKNLSDGEWSVKIRSSVDQQVTAKIGSQGVLIATLSLNFSSNCPPDATAIGGQAGSDVSGSTNKSTDSTDVIPVTPESKTNKETATAGSSSTTNIIYLVGGVLMLMMISAGGFVLFLKKKQNNSGVGDIEEIDPQVLQPPIEGVQTTQQSQPLVTEPQPSTSSQEISQPPQNPQPPLPPQA